MKDGYGMIRKTEVIRRKKPPPTKARLDVKGTLALMGFVLCWSSTPILLKVFTSFIDGWLANGIRYPASTLLFIPWLIYLKRRNTLPTGLWRLALIPALVNTASQILWAWSPYYLDAGMIGFIIRLSTVWAVIGAFIMFRDERSLMHSITFWAGLLLALGGFLSLSLMGKASLRGSTTVGLILVFSCSIFWASYQLSVRRNLSRISSPTAFGAVACLTCLPILISTILFSQPARILELTWTQNALVIASGLLGIGIGHVLFYIATKRLGVTISTATNLMGAFITALLSRWIFGESLTMLQWIGGGFLVLGGLFILNSQKQLQVQLSQERLSDQARLKRA